MSELNSAGIRATLGAGALILNDYQLKIEAIEGGHRLTAIKGSETQTMDVRDGVDGRSAYQFAVASGYAGTEAEFSEALAEVMEITGAEAARQAAEEKRQAAFAASEAERKAAFEDSEAGRERTFEAGEAARQTAFERAEAQRASNEQARQTAEAARQTAEVSRESAETARKDAETARATAEQGRKDAETARADAETARETAESGRADAEIQRQSDIAEAVGNANSAASAANSAAELAGSAAENANAAAENANGIVENLCTPFEETGGIVTCSPVEGQPLGAVSRIDAVQAGEGDPSPENVRPIQGWDSVTLSHTNDGGTEKTYTAALPETVYGGTLDWATGVLTINKKLHAMDGTETIVKLAENKPWLYYYNVNELQHAGIEGVHAISSHFHAKSSIWSTPGVGILTNLNYIIFGWDESQTAEAFKSYLASQYAAGTPVQVVYDLETPYTIQLTPQQIAALPGLNTLYSSTGDTIVSGPVSPPSQTAEIMERIAALEDADSGGGVKTVNGVAPDNVGNVKIDVGVKTVNGAGPDASGNVTVETAQADWNQSDATAADYVKNRPFYAVGESTIVPRSTYSITSGSGQLFKGNYIMPKIGMTYHVQFGELDVYKVATPGIYAGGIAIGEDANEFIIEVVDNATIYVLTSNVGTKVVEIAALDVRQIDPWFLPVAAKDQYGILRTSDLKGQAGHGAGTEIFNDYSGNQAIGEYNHAEGQETAAYGHATHAEGYGTIADGDSAHVEGRWNIHDEEGAYLHIVGNGEDEDNRSNAHTLDWSGNAWFAGTVEGTGMIVKSSTSGSSKRFKITVDDSGAISAAEI